MSRALKLLGLFFAFVVIFTLSRHVPTSTSSTTVASTTQVTTTTTATTTACQGSDFRGAYNLGQGAAGTISAGVTLTKFTAGTCSLKGWPILTLQDRSGALLASASIDLPTANSPVRFLVPQANQAPTQLTLHQGSLTSFSLAYSDVPVGNETCSSATTVGVELKTQGSVVAVTPDYPIEPCNHGSIWVSPFY